VNIYVASSWRNPFQPAVVRILRGHGHEVYDFRNPSAEDAGFHWSAIDPNWRAWSPQEYREALSNPIAQRGFDLDMNALHACDACVLVLPCGNSAHLELGWAVGAKRKTAVLFPGDIPATEIPDCYSPDRLGSVELELMPKMTGAILIGLIELDRWATQ